MLDKDMSCRTILKFIRDEHEASKEYKELGLPMWKDEAEHKKYLITKGRNQGCMDKPFFKSAVNSLK